MSIINLLYHRPSVSDDRFAAAFADFSVVIARRVRNAACLNNDQGVVSADRAAHYQWAKTKTRQQLLQNLEWKMVAGFRCLDAARQKTFFADLSVPIAQAPAGVPAESQGPRKWIFVCHDYTIYRATAKDPRPDESPKRQSGHEDLRRILRAAGYESCDWTGTHEDDHKTLSQKGQIKLKLAGERLTIAHVYIDNSSTVNWRLV
jgi:hypothetical protein